jgi:hypothetical protein
MFERKNCPEFMCMQVCHIFLENSRKNLQLFFKPCLNWRSTQEIMSLQSGQSPDFKNFGTPNLGVLGKMTFGCSPYGQAQKIL